MTTTMEHLAMDLRVCQALGKRPGESMLDAAERIMAAPHGNRAWRVAVVLLGKRKTPSGWDLIEKADKVARRLLRGREGA